MTIATQLPLADTGRDAWEYGPINRRAFRFFQEHAGYIVGEHAKCAAQLARAEAEGERRGLSVAWDVDDAADLGDHELWCSGYRADLARKAGQPVDSGRTYGGYPTCPGHYAEYAKVVAPDGTDAIGDICLPSLGGILDADDTYRRVVAAELMLEALS
jgi:hypothetical protein